MRGLKGREYELKTILILFLSLIINMNISGVSGVIVKQLKIDRQSFSQVYLILNSMILVMTFYLLSQASTQVTIPFFSLNYKIFLLPLVLICQFFIEYCLVYSKTDRNTKYRLPTNRLGLLAVGIMEELSYRLVIFSILLYVTKNNYVVSIVIGSLLYMFNHLFLIKSSTKKIETALIKFIFGLFTMIVSVYLGWGAAMLLHLFYNIILLYGFNYIFRKEVIS